MGTFALESWGAEAVEPWVVHRTFEDFSTGTLGDGGSNLYVTRSGTVQMIHRWDLNNDGFLDIFLAQDHDILENVDALVYWGRDGGPQSILPELRELQPRARLLRQIRQREANVTRLPIDGGGRSLLADLNQDGYPEIVFCNFIHNYSEHMIAFIYWGSEHGYQAERRTELPTILAGGVAAADFNGDGFVDRVGSLPNGGASWRRSAPQTARPETSMATASEICSSSTTIPRGAACICTWAGQKASLQIPSSGSMVTHWEQSWQTSTEMAIWT